MPDLWHIIKKPARPECSCMRSGRAGFYEKQQIFIEPGGGRNNLHKNVTFLATRTLGEKICPVCCDRFRMQKALTWINQNSTYRLSGRRMREAALFHCSGFQNVRSSKYSASTLWYRTGAPPTSLWLPPAAKGAASATPPVYRAEY